MTIHADAELPSIEGADTEPFARPFAIEGTEVSVSEGDTICRADESPAGWWYVVEGFADVTRHGVYLGTVGPGETIGEIALLDGRPRSATVVATTDMRLRTQTTEQFLTAIAASPGLPLELVRQLARRFRDLTERTTIRPIVGGGDESDTRDGPDLSSDRVEFNPFAPGYFADPAPQMNAIREQERVHHSELLGGYVLTRYDDVHVLARDRRFGVELAHARSTPAIEAERAQVAASRNGGLSMLRRDGDDHGRLRRLVSRAFTPKTIATWRTRTVAVCDDLLDGIERQGGGDLIDDFALRLPVQIISDLLGMPTDEVPRLRAWSHALAKSIDPLSPPGDREAAVTANQEMTDYLERMYQRKVSDPDDGIFSALIQANEHGDGLTRDEVIANVMLLYVAGHETTTNLIGNGVVELLRHPDQLEKVHTTPDLDANLVEEVLRFNSPVQFTRRFPLEDIPLDDDTIPVGSVVLLSATAANRDPRKWGPTADNFLIDRSGPNEQVSFGGGPHFCLGAALARLEGQVALPRLIRRFPRLRTIEEPVFEDRMILRGVANLPVVTT